MMDIPQVLLELQMGHKYTIVYFGKQGYPLGARFWLRGVCRIKTNIVILTIKPVGAPQRDVFIDTDSSFILWDDWIDPDCAIVADYYMKDSGHGILKMSRTWDKFDPRYLQRAMDSVTQAPVIWNIKPFFKEQLHDLCYVIE